MKGFTLIELLVIIGIMSVLLALSATAFRVFQKESDLINSAEEIINTLRLAQNKTLASEGTSQWGVYFSTTTEPNEYILFKGMNYASRVPASDEIHKLKKTVRISAINLAGKNEIVFERVSGKPSQSGSISLELKTNPLKSKTIYIESSGQIGLTGLAVPSDANRVKDSRHIHFEYSRFISISEENIILTFDNSVIETIVIVDNIKDAQIYWEREVNVGNEIQKLKIHTHRLNDPDTQFCVHRDKRFNTKSLKIEISGDISGDLIQYSAGNEITKGASIYVSEPISQ
jgi:Tfp pilus assembly protein FimT